MALYSLAQRTTATAAASPSWEIRSTSGNKPKVLQLELTQNTAVAGVYGIGRPAAIGVTPTSPQTFVDEADGNGATAQTTAAVAWGTAPTSPTNFNRRYSVVNTAGAGFIAVFPGGLGLPVSGSIVVWIIATAPVCDVAAVVSE